MMRAQGVDDRDRRVQDHSSSEHRTSSDAGALGDHGTAVDERVVLDDDRGGLRRFEHPAKTQAPVSEWSFWDGTQGSDAA